jgi:RNA polymerase sigma-70 factor (ECF subfamily)
MRLAALDRKDAFEALVVRHQSMVFGLATRFLGSRDQGRDVAQDVFLSLWAERHRYRTSGKFKSFLTSICLNRCRVIARGMKSGELKKSEFRRGMSAASDAQSNDIPLETLLESEQHREIQAYLIALPDKCRQAMIFRFTHGLSLAEISEQTGMPLGTVKSHLVRGVKRIRRMMKKGL